MTTPETPTMLEKLVDAVADAAAAYGETVARGYGVRATLEERAEAEQADIAARAALLDALREREEEIAKWKRRAEDAERGMVVIGPPPSPFLGGCNCAFKAPTVPVYRSSKTHLDDCPAKGSGFDVGLLPPQFSNSPQAPHRGEDGR